MAAPGNNSCESCRSFWSWAVVYCHQSYTQHCPTSICGHIASVFVCARYRLMDGYQLVLLTSANLIRTCFWTCCIRTWPTWVFPAKTAIWSSSHMEPFYVFFIIPHLLQFFTRASIVLLRGFGNVLCSAKLHPTLRFINAQIRSAAHVDICIQPKC